MNASSTVFERHAKKTGILLVLLPILAMDCAAQHLMGSKAVDDFRSARTTSRNG